jgi:hypothetical protein
MADPSSSHSTAISLASSTTSLFPFLRVRGGRWSSSAARPALSLLAGGNCPLQMRFGLHGAAGSSFLLRVPYALSLVAYWCVLQMQIGELLETSYSAQYYLNDEFLIYEQKRNKNVISPCVYIYLVNITKMI